jgi:hypothetical protein
MPKCYRCGIVVRKKEDVDKGRECVIKVQDKRYKNVGYVESLNAVFSQTQTKARKLMAYKGGLGGKLRKQEVFYCERCAKNIYHRIMIRKKIQHTLAFLITLLSFVVFLNWGGK